ncbi:MAG: hypothetical protein JW782_02730 [Candidatus Saganbacteria bacterium]|nr:hypothetical protein [Candidatus Saganbacteria bacterium]
MSIINRCRAVLRSFGSTNMIIDWLARGKLTRQELVRYASHDNIVLRFRVWMELNRNPELLISLAKKQLPAAGLFNKDIAELLKSSQAKPATVARVICACVGRELNGAKLAQAFDVVNCHSIPDQGDIMGEIGSRNQELFQLLHNKLNA